MGLLVRCDPLSAGRTETTTANLTQGLSREGQRYRIARPSADVQQVSVEIGTVEIDLGLSIGRLIDLPRIDLEFDPRFGQAANARSRVRSRESEPERVARDRSRYVYERSMVSWVDRVLVTADLERGQPNRQIEAGRLTGAKGE